MLPSPVRELLPRTYGSDTRARKRLLPNGIGHPAKMQLFLCRDLFLRYTLPGQTVLDPFGGVGGSLIGCTLGRNVVLAELEPPFAAHARANYAHLRGNSLPGVPMGEAEVLEGDSRRLPLSTADSVVTSPPYGDVASRDRSEEPYSHHRDPELRARYGTGDTNRHIDGYGDHTPGQIGDLAHTEGLSGRLTSPPYGDSLPNDKPGWGFRNPELFGGGMPAYTDYGATDGQIGAMRHDPGDAGVVASPPFANSLQTKGEGAREWVRPNGKAVGLGVSNWSDYGHSEGQIGAEEGDTYAAAVLAVYRECYRVVKPGGVLVLVTGNYVRDGAVIDLAADTIRLAEAAGWIPVERWRHQKANVSFWRRLHHRQGRPVVTHEDVLVFVKGHQGWPFADLPPTTTAAALLTTPKRELPAQPMLELTA